MSDPRVTDERLKVYLNNRQSDQERLCCALLALDSAYSNIEPRRPEGGPDGARDIQCSFNGVKCFGAVGFKNNAGSSDRQVGEIKKKFRDDVDSALNAEPNLKSFVFLTNVDLAPGAQEEMKEYARNRGIASVELYWRERLRLALDSVEGYALRYSFLDISLSDAEQKAFFARFGEDLQSLISGRMDSLEERIEEIQFINWRQGACRTIQVEIHLRETYDISGNDHTPYRFALRLQQPMNRGTGTILLGCYSVIHQGADKADFECKRFVYTDTELIGHQRKQHTRISPFVRVCGQPFDVITLSCAFQGNGLSVEALSTFEPWFHCSTDWVHRIEHVNVWYDDYLVSRISSKSFDSGVGGQSTSISHWLDDADSLKDTPVLCTHGFSALDFGVCKRRRPGR